MRNFCPGWVPGGILSTTRRPSSVFTLILEPSSACARFTGTVQTMSSPSRRKNRSGSTCSTTTTSPFPFVPCPRRRSLVPSSVPAGTVIIRRFSTRTSPLPPQVWHRSEGTRPLPRHTGHGGFAVNRPCPVCRGRGRVPSERCHTCGGSGEVRVEKRLMITVPAGTEDGTKLRLRGQGTKGKGDVVVVLQVEPDRFFRREGLDIVCTVPVNLAQALLGSKIKVKTLDGRRVVLKIPPGTQHGQKFRIAGQGIEKNGRRGDQYVEVHVDIPEHLTPEQEAADIDVHLDV